MKIHNYHPETHKYLSSEDAAADPLEYKILVEKELERRYREKNAGVKDLRKRVPLSDKEKTENLPAPVKFLIPAFATIVPLPENVPPGHAVIFSDGAWKIVEEIV